MPLPTKKTFIDEGTDLGLNQNKAYADQLSLFLIFVMLCQPKKTFIDEGTDLGLH
jgi:hypothetical protein